MKDIFWKTVNNRKSQNVQRRLCERSGDTGSSIPNVSWLLYFYPHFLTSEFNAREQSSHHLYVVRRSGRSPVWTAMLPSWCYLQPAGFDMLFFVDVFWSQNKIYISLSVSFIRKQRKPVWSSLFFAGFHFCFASRSPRDTSAKHNMRNAGKRLAETTRDGPLSNMTNHQRLSEEVWGTFCG